MSFFKKLGAVFVTLGFIFGSMLTLFNSTATALGPDIGPWQTSTNSLPVKLYGQASAVNNNYAYILGGYTSTGGQSIVDSVYYAQLNSDGSVGTWQTSVNTLPQAMYGVSAVAQNDYIYVFGGIGNGGSTSASKLVYYAHLNADGSVGTWQTSSNQIPEGVYFSGAVLNNNYVYLVANTGDTGYPINSVYYAHLNSDGSIGTWAATSSLPGARQAAATAIYNGYIYVSGGFKESNYDYSSDIYYAHINSDGSLGAWQTNSLPEGSVGAESIATGGYLYLIGGAAGPDDSHGRLSAGAYYTRLNSDGSIGPWQTSTYQTPSALGLSSIIVSPSNYVYLMAGQGLTDFSDSVFYTQLPIFDTTSPTITSSFSPLANSNGWNNNSVTVTFSCADESQGSGLASCTSPVTLSTEGQNQIVIGTAVDNAGNTGTTTVSLNIDKTAPIASSPTLSTSLILFSANVTMNANVTDALSGVAAGEFYIDTDPGQGQGTPMAYSNGKIIATKTISGVGLGQHRVYMRSKDKAGNWSLPVSVQFIYIGF